MYAQPLRGNQVKKIRLNKRLGAILGGASRSVITKPAPSHRRRISMGPQLPPINYQQVVVLKTTIMVDLVWAGILAVVSFLAEEMQAPGA